jgi:hypothetical protein
MTHEILARGCNNWLESWGKTHKKVQIPTVSDPLEDPCLMSPLEIVRSASKLCLKNGVHTTKSPWRFKQWRSHDMTIVQANCV